MSVPFKYIVPIVRLYLSLPFSSTSMTSPAIKFAKNCFDFLPYGCLSSGASMPKSLTLTCCLPCNTVIVSPSWIETTLPERAKRYNGNNIAKETTLFFKLYFPKRLDYCSWTTKEQLCGHSFDVGRVLKHIFFRVVFFIYLQYFRGMIVC